MTTLVTTDVTDGTTIDASDLNNNLTAIKAVVNGNIDNSNVSSGAGIAVSKLAPAGTNGHILTTSGGVAAWAAAAGGGGPTITYASTPPGSPADGDIWYLVDSTTAATYQWAFRFNSSASGTYKWEFIGGAPFYSEIAPNHTITSGTQVASTGYYYESGATFTTPRAGDWVVQASAQLVQNGASGSCGVSVFYGTSVSTTAARGGKLEATYNTSEGLSTLSKFSALSSGILVGACSTANTPGTNQVAVLSFSIVPQRVI